MRSMSPAALLLLLIPATACGGPTAAPTPPAPTADGGVVVEPTPIAIPAPLTLDALKNAAYTLPGDGATYALAGGVYAEPAPDGGATALVNLSLLESPIAFGDLDGDGAEDAAVILVDAPGGSGVFGYLAAVRNAGGAPENVGTVELGDRTRVDGIDVAGGEIILDVTAHGPNDPLCCPSEQRRWTYRLEDGVLAPVDDVLLGTAAPAESGVQDELPVPGESAPGGTPSP